PTVPPRRRVVYEQADRDARDLAARLVGLAAFGRGAVVAGLARTAFEPTFRGGTDAAYVLRVRRRTVDACGAGRQPRPGALCAAARRPEGSDRDGPSVPERRAGGPATCISPGLHRQRHAPHGPVDAAHPDRPGSHHQPGPLPERIRPSRAGPTAPTRGRAGWH